LNSHLFFFFYNLWFESPESVHLRLYSNSLDIWSAHDSYYEGFVTWCTLVSTYTNISYNLLPQSSLHKMEATSSSRKFVTAYKTAWRSVFSKSNLDTHVPFFCASSPPDVCPRSLTHNRLNNISVTSVIVHSNLSLISSLNFFASTPIWRLTYLRKVPRAYILQLDTRVEEGCFNLWTGWSGKIHHLNFGNVSLHFQS
jgi:hypothetical protein